MSTTQDNFELDPTNEEFNQALEFIKHTNRLVYLTGKAGTGKTTFLKHLKTTSQKNVVVLAPTGVAAINAGGETIHSFFQIPPSLYVPDDPRLREKPREGDPDRSTIYDHFKYKRKKLDTIRALDLLVIDEVSMVRCDLLDVVDRLLRVFRGRRDVPFGGVQTLLIGDAFQLPPVAKPNEWNVLEERGYSSPFFFGSKVLEAHKAIYIELKKIYRQKEEEFIALLNRVRINEVSEREMQAINARYDQSFEPPSDQGYIILGTHNAQVDAINEGKLQALETPLHQFDAEIDRDFPERYYPTDDPLRLKQGAQVMFLKNDKDSGVYNGSIGRVIEIDGSRVVVALPDGRSIVVKRYEWKNVRYAWDEEAQRIKEDVLGTFTQYPLRLAWAITVHKSQGLTFEKVIADIGSAFASGQVYVALSRCTSFNGLVLRSRIDRSAIKTDPDVLRFAKQETPGTLIVEELNSGKADGFYRAARTAFRLGRFAEAYADLLAALKYRNDLGTDLFRRYIDVHTTRLAQWPKRYQDVEFRLQDSLSQSLVLADGLNGQLDANDELGRELTELTSRYTELREKMTIAEDQIVADERKEQEQQWLLAALRSKVKKLNDSLTSAQNQVAAQEKDLGEKSKKLSEQDHEIQRLRNLSWWDKLWGAK